MSNADRQKRYRDSKRNAGQSESVTGIEEECNAPVTETVTRTVTGAPKSVTPEPDRNAPKVTPQDAPQSTNVDEGIVEHPRNMALPGDTDYVGCCKQVDGVWQVDNTKPPIKDMSDVDSVRP